MCFVWFETLQIPIVRCIKDCNEVVDSTRVFFLKDTLELTLDLVAVLVILAIVAHFVNKEKGEALNATVEKFLFFSEVSNDGLPYLYALHRFLVGIADYIAAINRSSVKERNVATATRIYFGNDKIIILCKTRSCK